MGGQSKLNDKQLPLQQDHLLSALAQVSSHTMQDRRCHSSKQLTVNSKGVFNLYMFFCKPSNCNVQSFLPEIAKEERDSLSQ